MPGEEYYLKRLSQIRWVVAKFDSTSRPIAIYHIKYDVQTGKGYCPCYGFHHALGPCRHLKMIADWWYQGCPIPQAFSPYKRKALYYTVKGRLTP